MTKSQLTALQIGLLIIALCALFPPRMYFGDIPPKMIGSGYSTALPSALPSRAFILSPQFHLTDGVYSEHVQIDTGRMIAEWMIIAIFTILAVFHLSGPVKSTLSVNTMHEIEEFIASTKDSD